MKTVQVLLTMAILAAFPGCGCLVMTYHNAAVWTCRHWSAEKAWRVRKWMYADIPCRGSFKSGFKAGYRFANGGYDSCEPPQLRHYWRIGALTPSERQNAQAWSDGFTHGTVAAQQDHAAGPSAFDTAAMQPPEGVPDVRYYTPPQVPNEMGPGGGFQYPPDGQMPPSYSASAMPGYPAPPTANGNFQYAPIGDNFQYSPVAPPSPLPGSEAMPGSGSPMPSQFGPPQFAPPPAPASMPAANVQFLPSPLAASEGAPGIGSLRAADLLPPAPPAEPGPAWSPQQQAAAPVRQATQAADWELPLIRE